MEIFEALRIKPGKPEMLSLVGGGGKTTTMFALAQALKQKGCRVLVTTTTNIFYPEPGQCDSIVMDSSPSVDLFRAAESGIVVCLGGGVFGELKKVKSIAPDFLDRLFAENIFDHILVEADGAKRKAIKASAEYEPVIPDLTTGVIGVIGTDALGQAVEDKNVHRLEKFCEITGLIPGKIIDEKTVVTLIEHSGGLFKGTPENAVRTVLLNKADTEKRRKQCRVIAGLISADTGINAVLSASMEQVRVHECYRIPCG